MWCKNSLASSVRLLALLALHRLAVIFSHGTLAALPQSSRFPLLPANYTGYRLVSAISHSDEEFRVARALHARGKLELWSEVPAGDGTFLFSVNSNHFESVRATLADANVSVRVLETDLQRLIDDENPPLPLYSSGVQSRPIDLHHYEAYDQIVASIDHYATEQLAFNGVVERFVLGKSYEGRDIVGVRVSGSDERKPVVFIECGIHAREWASTSTCLYMIDQLVTNQREHKDLLDRFEFRIVPSSNPDGYEYSRNVNRLWRKNRKPTFSWGLRVCSGVDLNRNFEAGPHCGVGTERNPCSDTYCGEQPFSEPETAALRDYLSTIKADVEYYVSLHAFGLMWMFPYSHTKNHCADHDELMKLTQIGVEAIRQKTGSRYKYGPIASTIYAVTGSSIDWAYDTLGIRKSFIIELQPSLESNGFLGRGFLLPAHQIVPVGKETFAGLKAMWMA